MTQSWISNYKVTNVWKFSGDFGYLNGIIQFSSDFELGWAWNEDFFSELTENLQLDYPNDNER